MPSLNEIAGKQTDQRQPLSTIMPWTVLNFDGVDFASVQNDNVRVVSNESWESAKVSVIAMSEHERESNKDERTLSV